MEKELPFDFWYYHKANSACTKPLDDISGIYKESRELSVVRNCTVPSTIKDEEFERIYYNGGERIYFYDIKLCHTTHRQQYKPFIQELLRRSEAKPCSVHISNSMIPQQDKSLKSLYDIPYFIVIVKMILTAQTDLIIEISNKVDNDNDSLVYKTNINKVVKLLEESKNVKHYMIREEVYKKRPLPNNSFLREDSHDTLFIERKRMDNVDHKYDIINK